MWYKQNEYMIGESITECSMRSWFYTQGIAHVPRIFLGETKPYGQVISDHEIKIQIDDYYRVAASVRRAIQSDIDFKTRIRKKMWCEFKSFQKIISRLEHAVFDPPLSPALFNEAIAIHGRVCAFIELNAMLPVTWYKERLSEAMFQEQGIRFDDFTFCEVIPHRVLVRWAKLRLFRDGQLQRNPECFPIYIQRYSYLDPSLDALYATPEKIMEQIQKELEQMEKTLSVEDARHELLRTYQNMQRGKTRYFEKLQQTEQVLKEAGASPKDAQEFKSALTMISLVATEEEYRHILQARFWRILGAIARGFDLPIDRTSCEEISKTLALRPHVKFTIM